MRLFLWGRQVLAATMVFVILSGCQIRDDTAAQIWIANPSDIDRVDEQVEITASFLRDLGLSIENDSLSLVNAEQQVAGQWVDRDLDGEVDAILFNVSIPAQSRIAFWITSEAAQALVKRSHAELGVRKNAGFSDGRYQGGMFETVESMDLPAGHSVGNGLFKYEGPGWESDKIGYRLYFDQRNVIDIFGKRRTDILLPDVGQVGSPSYHELQEWGMDVLKTGLSLGIGSVVIYADEQVRRIDNSERMQVQISAAGPVYSEVVVRHRGFRLAEQKADIVTRYGISAGSALTQVNVAVDGALPGLATGIVKHEENLIRSDSSDGAWQYIATFGKQSYIGDKLGMAVFFRQQDLELIGEDEHNHLVVMKPATQQLTYYFAGYWQQDVNAITDQQHFIAELDNTLNRLNQPLTVHPK